MEENPEPSIFRSGEILNSSRIRLFCFKFDSLNVLNIALYNAAFQNKLMWRERNISCRNAVNRKFWYLSKYFSLSLKLIFYISYMAFWYSLINGIVFYMVGCHSCEAILSECVPSVFWGDTPAVGGEMQGSACLLHVVFHWNGWYLMSDRPYSLGNSVIAGDSLLTDPWYYWWKWVRAVSVRTALFLNTFLECALATYILVYSSNVSLLCSSLDGVLDMTNSACFCKTCPLLVKPVLVDLNPDAIKTDTI